MTGPGGDTNPTPDARARVQINYKSGISVVVECESFTVRRSGTAPGLSKIECESAQPRPLFFGIDDIESVWELS